VDQSSFLTTTHGAAGTAGWRAPEILCGDDKLDTLATGDDTMSSIATTINGSVSSCTSIQIYLTKSVDIFALGCLFYYILTKGRHPYGNRFDREANIIKENKDLSLCSDEEAHDLITRMLHRQPSQRPNIETCLLHPFFWDPTKRLGFFRDASDRFEVMCKNPMDRVLIRLEEDARSIVGADWHQTLDQILIRNLRQSRKYDGGSVRDLLRALRNKVRFSSKYLFFVEFF
jgi:serine/threonine protein kinase